MLRTGFAIAFVAAWTCAAVVTQAADSTGPRAAAAGPAAAETTAAGLVRSALTAESQGDLARRKQLLAEALEADAASAAANWQLGRVFYQGAWLSVDEAAERARQDKLLADYREMRGRLGDSADAAAGAGPPLPEERAGRHGPGPCRAAARARA